MLDLHPACREFIMGVDGVQTYEGVRVRIIKGRNPDLFITHPYEKQIDLTTVGSARAMHDLMIAHGFVRRSPHDMLNKHLKCFEWAYMGECIPNKAFMDQECPIACRDLSDRHDACPGWADDGECERNPAFMNRNCHATCAAKHEL